MLCEVDLSKCTSGKLPRIRISELEKIILSNLTEEETALGFILVDDLYESWCYVKCEAPFVKM